jgi:hypothetical protein
MTLIEKINHRFPELGKRLATFSQKRKTTVWQDMLLCTAVTLSSAFYEFEAFMPATAADIIKTLLLIFLIVCWLWCAFLNGFWKKYSFLVFAAAFWFIPRLIIIRRANMSILNYNRFLDAASQYSGLLVEVSLTRLSGLINTTALITAIILIGWCVVFFFGGKMFRNSFTQH